MRKPNIVIIVLDTLREDHAQGLDRLVDYGFVKYQNAIAPRPLDTTLPCFHAHRPIPLRTRNTRNKGTTDRRRGIVRIFATKNERT